MYPIAFIIYYLFVGIPEMNKYWTAKEKGRRVKRIDYGLWNTIHYEKGPITRDYLTVKEFHKNYWK